MRTSEWVSLGHPDKTADAISEYILDRFIEQDKDVRYAVEVLLKGNNVTLGGEISSEIYFSNDKIKQFVKEAIEKVGYNTEYHKKWGDNVIDPNNLNITIQISEQSPDIAVGVVDKQGWNDQGVFMGYAENNPYTNYMPLDHFLAKDLGMKLYYNALENNIGGLDIKTQITLEDDETGQEHIKQVIVAIPCLTIDEYEQIKNFVREWIMKENVFDVENNNRDRFIENNVIINGTGIYQQHGSVADAGVTGRKLAVDFYGLNAPIGGGSPWTKSGQKADLTLNMFARKLAKELIEGGDCDKSYCKLSSCIGKQKVLGERWVETNGLKSNIETFEADIVPNDLIKKFELDKPNYFELNKNGLFLNI